jgi:hypothetical protein
VLLRVASSCVPAGADEVAHVRGTVAAFWNAHTESGGVDHYLMSAVARTVLSDVLTERGKSLHLSSSDSSAIAGEVTRRLLAAAESPIDPALKAATQREAADVVLVAVRDSLRAVGQSQRAQSWGDGANAQYRALQFQLRSKLGDHLSIGIPETARILSNMWVPTEPLRLDGRLFRWVCIISYMCPPVSSSSSRLALAVLAVRVGHWPTHTE